MTKPRSIQSVLITGGAGYVGAALVPRLLKASYKVRVLDLYLFGDDVLSEVKGHPGLEEIKGDLRDQALLKTALRGCDGVIHLACISNDPSFELNPALGRSINYEAFGPLVHLSKMAGVRRFIYASSSSVYGVSDALDVTEEHPLAPLTDYSKYKSLCEPMVLKEISSNFIPVVIRPATVCGYSPRQRLDLTVNILTNHALHQGRITVYGGSQMRPNIHIQDMAALYQELLELPEGKIAGKIFNVGYENRTVSDLAQIVSRTVRRKVPERNSLEIVTTPTDDQRSYRICSEKIRRELGFVPRHTIENAVEELIAAFAGGRIPNPMSEARYYNIKTMQAAALK